MKKKQVKKVAEVKPQVAQEEVKKEVKKEEQQRKVHPLSAWDNLMFMGRRPQASEAAATNEDSTEEK